MYICMLPVIMIRRKTDDVVEGIVMGLLKQNMSYRKIINTVKEMDIAFLLPLYTGLNIVKVFLRTYH